MFIEREWHNSHGELHRENDLAVIYHDVVQEWWVEGVLQSKKQIERLIKSLGILSLPAAVKTYTVIAPPDLSNVKIWSGTDEITPKDDFDLSPFNFENEDDKIILH